MSHPQTYIHPENSLGVAINLWLILLSKIVSFLNLVKHPLKHLYISIFQMPTHFLSGFSGCQVIRIFVLFHWIKVAKHI